jgi:hypothetical protein
MLTKWSSGLLENVSKWLVIAAAPIQSVLNIVNTLKLLDLNYQIRIIRNSRVKIAESNRSISK